MKKTRMEELNTELRDKVNGSGLSARDLHSITKSIGSEVAETKISSFKNNKVNLGGNNLDSLAHAFGLGLVIKKVRAVKFKD